MAAVTGDRRAGTGNKLAAAPAGRFAGFHRSDAQATLAPTVVSARSTGADAKLQGMAMFKTILLPVDLSEASSWERALPAALLHAKSGGGRLNVMTVVPDYGKGAVGTYFPADFIDRAISGAKDHLQALLSAQVPKDVPVRTIVRTGTIYHEIIDVAKEIGADLIVMASHRPALRDYLLGPNAERVMRHANCSVLVVRS